MNLDKKIKVYVGNKEYIAYVAETEEDKVQGLSNVTQLDWNEALLFDYSDDPQDSLVFNTKDMNFPIDIIFIDDNNDVVAIAQGIPGSNESIQCVAGSDEKLKYVLEVNVNSGIRLDDEIDIEDNDEFGDVDDDFKMYIIGSDGNPQMDLVGGERIFSRKNSRTLIKLAKRANKSKKDSDYKKLGKIAFKYLYQQDNRPEEYVNLPEDKK